METTTNYTSQSTHPYYPFQSSHRFLSQSEIKNSENIYQNIKVFNSSNQENMERYNSNTKNNNQPLSSASNQSQELLNTTANRRFKSHRLQKLKKSQELKMAQQSSIVPYILLFLATAFLILSVLIPNSKIYLTSSVLPITGSSVLNGITKSNKSPIQPLFHSVGDKTVDVGLGQGIFKELKKAAAEGGKGRILGSFQGNPSYDADPFNLFSLVVVVLFGVIICGLLC